MDKSKILDDWILQKCAQCKYFRKRVEKQRLNRCINQEITKDTISGIYYCSEYEPKNINKIKNESEYDNYEKEKM